MENTYKILKDALNKVAKIHGVKPNVIYVKWINESNVQGKDFFVDSIEVDADIYDISLNQEK